MRLLLLTAAALLPAASAAAPPDVRPAQPRGPQTAANCPKVTDYHATEPGRSARLKKLTELPPATAYMAVYRTKNGCLDPLTLVDYRSGGRR